MSEDGGIEVRRQHRPNFAAVPLALARDGTLGDKAYRLWIVLLSYADFSDRSAFPKVSTLAADCGCAVATVWRAQSVLVKRGLLQVDSGKERGKANIYTLLEPVDNPAEVSRPRERGIAPTRDQVSRPRDSQGEQEPTNDTQLPNGAGAPLRLVDMPTDIEKLCTLLADQVEAHRGTRPKITAAWPTAMDLLVRRGPTEWAEPAEIRPGVVAHVIRGIFKHLAAPKADGFCWADQIRSPGNLRAKWEVLTVQLRNAEGPRPARPNSDGDARTLPELTQAAYEAEQRERSNTR